MTRDDLLARLRELKPWLEEQGITDVRLFGSRARDEARPDSDVDLLVRRIKPLGLRFFGIEQELSEKLGLEVTMATEEGLPPDILYTARRDAIHA
jgi:uncharacterized protein